MFYTVKFCSNECFTLDRRVIVGNPGGHPDVHGRLRPPSVRQPLQQLLQSPHGLRSYLRPQAAPEAAPGPVQQTVPR